MRHRSIPETESRLSQLYFIAKIRYTSSVHEDILYDKVSIIVRQGCLTSYAQPQKVSHYFPIPDLMTQQLIIISCTLIVQSRLQVHDFIV